MMYVDRTNVPAPQSLTNPGSAGQRELLKLRALDALGRKGFIYRAYRSEDVRQALTALFNERCAYCESPVTAASDIEIEHYRPKAGVEEDSAHPGYWWLGAAWDNVLLTCKHCNQRRNHRLAVRGMTKEDLIRAARDNLLGKATSFPIRATRAVNEGDDLDAEQPLLLNPCRDDPTESLAWIFDESERLSLMQGVDDSGKQTVHMLGLNRQGLVTERTKRLIILRAEYEDAKATLIRAAQEVGDFRQYLIDQTIQKLENMKRLEHPYPGLSHAFWKWSMDNLEKYFTVCRMASSDTAVSA